MSKASPSLLRSLAPLYLALILLTGCGQNGCTSTSTYTVDVFGVKKSWKTISRTENGVTRTLETRPEVQLKNGQITNFPPHTVIKLEETGGKQPRVAELRENAGKLELWISDNGNFRYSTVEEDAWLNTFLLELSK